MSGRPDRRAISRRETLRRGAVLGGATLWATPIVQSLTARPAFAQATPPPDGPDGEEAPSFIAMDVTCSGLQWVIKLECNGTCEFEDDPFNFPSCDDFEPNSEKRNGDDLRFFFTEPDELGCVIVTVPENCTVDESAIKSAHTCCSGPTGTGPLGFCPCPG